MRQRFFPFTAGAWHGSPDRVRAPQRGLASIGPVLRRWCGGSGAIFGPFLSQVAVRCRLPPFGAGCRRPATTGGRSFASPADQITARCPDRHLRPFIARQRMQFRQSLPSPTDLLATSAIRADQNPSSGRLLCMGLFYQNLIYYSKSH